MLQGTGKETRLGLEKSVRRNEAAGVEMEKRGGIGGYFRGRILRA